MHPRLEDHILFHYHKAMIDIVRQRKGQVMLVVVLRRSGALGELSVDSAWLRDRSNDYQILLSTTHLWLLYILCRAGSALTAKQVATRLDRSLYIQNEAEEDGPRTTRTAVRKQVERTRDAIRSCLCSAGLEIAAEDILQAAATSTRETRYRMTAHVRFYVVEGDR